MHGTYQREQCLKIIKENGVWNLSKRTVFESEIKNGVLNLSRGTVFENYQERCTELIKGNNI